MNVSPVAERVFVINLDERKDRYDRVASELCRVGIEFERFPGVWLESLSEFPKSFYRNYGTGWAYTESEEYIKRSLGCTISHLEILKLAEKEALRNVLIFEDDVQFIGDYEGVWAHFLEELPDEWDVLYLGTNHIEKPSLYSEYVSVPTLNYSTHAYAVGSHVYDEVLDNVLRSGYVIDRWFGECFNPSHDVYCVRPPIAVQRPDFSDILGRDVDYRKVLGASSA